MQLVAGLVLVLFRTVFGVRAWVTSLTTQATASTWTVMLAALPVILGVQMLLSFVARGIGSTNTPNPPALAHDAVAGIGTRRQGMTLVALKNPPRSRIPVLVCLVLGLLGTLPLVVLTPPFQVPDEMQHFDRAYQVSEGHVFAEVKDGVAGGMLPSSLDALTRIFLGTNAIDAPRPVAAEPLATTLLAREIPLKPHQTEFINFTNMAAYSPLAYLPQAAGIALGRLFGAGPLVLLYLARLLNALTVVILLSIAIGIMPFGRPLALLGALLPMALYEYASASADGIAIADAFLITALELRALTEGSWRRRDVLVTALVGLIVCSTKPVYAPLLLIAAPAALIPRQRRNQLLALSVILLVAVGGGGLWFWENSGRLININQHAGAHAQALFVATHPFAFLAAMARTFRIDSVIYWYEMVGALGWLKISFPGFVYKWTMVGFGLGWLASGREQTRIHFAVSLWWLLMAAGAITLIMLAIYIDWSHLGATRVHGPQGRYFIPLLALFAAMVSALPAPRMGQRLYVGLFSAISFVLVLNVLVVIARVCLAYQVL